MPLPPSVAPLPLRGVLFSQSGSIAVAGVFDIKTFAAEQNGSLPLDLVRSDSILGYRRTYPHCPF